MCTIVDISLLDVTLTTTLVRNITHYLPTFSSQIKWLWSLALFKGYRVAVSFLLPLDFYFVNLQIVDGKDWRIESVNTGWCWVLYVVSRLL